MAKRTSSLFLGFLFVLGSCYEPGPEFIPVEQVAGFKPVYGSSNATQIMMTSPRSIAHPGKIYLYGKYLFVNEKSQGIHVFDNSDPAEPLNLGFLQLLGNTDMAIRDSLLYADYLGNIVALTVNDFGTIEEKGRLPLHQWTNGVPAPPGFYFECADSQKGTVVYWQEAQLTNHQCYAHP
jgi:hypothetical protein